MEDVGWLLTTKLTGQFSRPQATGDRRAGPAESALAAPPRLWTAADPKTGAAGNALVAPDAVNGGTSPSSSSDTTLGVRAGSGSFRPPREFVWPCPFPLLVSPKANVS